MRFNGRWYLSRSHGANTTGEFITTEPATSATINLVIAQRQPLSIGPEDLSLWPSGFPTGRCSERYGASASSAGKRMVYSVNPK